MTIVEELLHFAKLAREVRMEILFGRDLQPSHDDAASHLIMALNALETAEQHLKIASRLEGISLAECRGIPG